MSRGSRSDGNPRLLRGDPVNSTQAATARFCPDAESSRMAALCSAGAYRKPSLPHLEINVERAGDDGMAFDVVLPTKRDEQAERLRPAPTDVIVIALPEPCEQEKVVIHPRHEPDCC